MADESIEKAKSDRGQRSWFYPARFLARASLTVKHVAVGAKEAIIDG